MDQPGLENVKQFGKYRIIAHLATGGMADIYLASRKGLGGFEKLVVIKAILPGLSKNKDVVQMMLDEARIAANLNHPNVVQVFDVGCIDKQYYIAMEYLSGESLASVLSALNKNNQKLPPELAAGVILQVAEGLHHAHTMLGKDGEPQNIVHRDISPQNVFVLYSGVVKVVDFGIAKAVMSRTKTTTGALKGKFIYMSPEQVLGEKLDARSDIFSLGIVMWESLTGRRLYKKGSDYSVLQSIIKEDAPSPLEFNSDLPPRLVEINRKALVREREGRYQSAAEFRADLAAYLKQSPIEGDSMAIGGLMKRVFPDNIKVKRQLIEGALEDAAVFEAATVDEPAPLPSETRMDTPHQATAPAQKRAGVVSESPQSQLTVEVKPWTRAQWAVVILLVLVACAALATTIYIWKQTRSDPPGTPDAGAVITVAVPVPAEPDAGLTEDAGTRPADVAVTLTRPPKKRKKARGKGSLSVNCLPWCEIKIDGRKLKQTSPLINHRLPAGPHLVEVINPPSGAKDSKRIVIKRGKAEELKFRLK